MKWGAHLLLPLLFNCVLEQIFRKPKWEQKSVNMNSEKFNNLRFAENVVLISKNIQKLNQILKTN